MKFYSLIVQSGSGSAGGVTISHNKGGFYIKNRAVPTNPNSARQQATRTQLGNAASNWSLLLTPAQRDAWNTYAQNHTIKDAIGADIYINGINWYIMFNTRLADAALTAIAVPPAGSAPNGFLTFACDVSALNTVDVTFTAAVPAGHVIQLWQTLPVSAGSTPNFNQTRLVGYSGAAEASPWAATLPFGVPAGNQVVFFGCIMDADGQCSVKSTDTDLVDFV